MNILLTEKQLYEITLLREQIDEGDILDAIEEKWVVRIYYSGDEEIERGWRAIEIYAYGISTAGNKVIRAFQLQGYTKTLVQKWKLFRVDKIKSIEFIRPFSQLRPQFNRNGDRGMIRVIKLAK